MSYSRWSHSVWYTYADVGGGFTICGERNFSDEELKDLDACIEIMRNKSPENNDKPYTEEELKELREYMENYCASYLATASTAVGKDEKT